ncbi:MAG TPA: permease, partial [Candidatus Dormibacteraeota bacterium]|nr:permease [Candidatus Dormibacteraeota bacterium]
LLASLSGVPFYFCSGAELPLVKELLAKGMGFGPATAMMLAVPIVNLPTFGVVAKWLGPRPALLYLVMIVVFTTLLGAIAGLFTTF